MEDQRCHTVVASQNGCPKSWSESRGTHGIALDGEDWCDEQERSSLLMGPRKKKLYYCADGSFPG